MELDLKGLKCPLPVLKANKAIKGLAPGEAVTVYVTDPAAPKDFETYAETAGHAFLGCVESDGVFTIELRKAE